MWVTIPLRRHSEAKRKTLAAWPAAIDHHHQFSETPPSRTIRTTCSGVSLEKVVATIEVPAIHHGRLRPARKKSVPLRDARRRTRIAISTVAAR